MKRIFYLLLTLLFAAAVSCSKDSTSGQEGGLLSVTPSALEFDTGGGSELIELKTDAGSWSLMQSDGTAWCTPERTSGRTSTSFHITVTSNAGGTERSTTLTFTAPGCEEVVLSLIHI